MGSVILVVPSLLYCCVFFINYSISQPIDYSAEAKILLHFEGIEDPTSREKMLAKKIVRGNELVKREQKRANNAEEDKESMKRQYQSIRNQMDDEWNEMKKRFDKMEKKMAKLQVLVSVP